MIHLAKNALTTPDRYIATSGDNDSAVDAITMKINAISERLVSFCGRQFGYVSYPTSAPQLLQGTGLAQIFLAGGPIRTVDQVRINGAEIPVVIASPTDAFPLYGATVYRNLEWDKLGMIYCPLGFTMWGGAFGDVTGDPDVRSSNLLYNVQVAWTGGFILPQFDGVTNSATNPTGAPTDIAADLEEAICIEISNRLSRPNRQLIRERTPGGYEQGWENKPEGEWSSETLPVFLSYRIPRAVWA